MNKMPTLFQSWSIVLEDQNIKKKKQLTTQTIDLQHDCKEHIVLARRNFWEDAFDLQDTK